MTRNWFALRERGVDLKGDDLAIIAVLAQRVDNRTGETFVGVPELARVVGYGRDKVMGCLGRLREAGIITRTARNCQKADGTWGKTTDLIRACPETRRDEPEEWPDAA
jgi:hypothetical protein